jgi:biopolymer transport protein ExbB
MNTALLLAQAPPPAVKLDSLYDFIVASGPIMWPLGLCSVVALAFTVERWLRLQRGAIGSRRFGESIVEALKSGGKPAALAACAAKKNALARILQAGIDRLEGGAPAIEKAIEDAGSREVRRMTSSLRPLASVVTIAPLLGLLGTVWGMVEAFSNIALKGGMGKPELLASGISQALITTVAGLVIAIPTQAIYYWFKGRIDGFVKDVEDLHGTIDAVVRGPGAATS